MSGLEHGNVSCDAMTMVPGNLKEKNKKWRRIGPIEQERNLERSQDTLE